ncbi:unnamed protein product [Polarella glacialis]|uniref:Uncharacterized protein n=1 Tax=Polarella glacialis TaxID=89957 RepID=A0A813K4Y2_POLGL|nr:unnamed protein product [Polarella glacialis]|mmetsp:Transcript_64342/g.104082  ORF Transcript_64342/g.104082 Transcript_64342/m.104082 type:complete len:150 (-) Transcript_64342:111-560(-)
MSSSRVLFLALSSAFVADATLLRTSIAAEAKENPDCSPEATACRSVYFRYPHDIDGLRTFANETEACDACLRYETQNCGDWGRCTCYSAKVGGDNTNDHVNYKCKPMEGDGFQTCFNKLRDGVTTDADKYHQPVDGMSKLNINCTALID